LPRKSFKSLKNEGTEIVPPSSTEIGGGKINPGYTTLKGIREKSNPRRRA